MRVYTLLVLLILTVVSFFGAHAAVAKQDFYLLFCDHASCSDYTTKYSALISSGVLRFVNLDDKTTTYPEGTWSEGDAIPLLRMQNASGNWSASSLTDSNQIVAMLDAALSSSSTDQVPKKDPCMVSPHYSRGADDGSFSLREDIYNDRGRITAHSGQIFTQTSGSNPLTNSSGVYVKRGGQLVQIGPSNVGNSVPTLSGASVRVTKSHVVSESEYGSERAQIADCDFASSSVATQADVPEVANEHTPTFFESIFTNLLQTILGGENTVVATTSCSLYGTNPVCGSDGVTYTNSCYLDQQGVDQAGVGICTQDATSALEKIGQSGIPNSLLQLLQQAVFSITEHGSSDEVVLQ